MFIFEGLRIRVNVMSQSHDNVTWKSVEGPGRMTSYSIFYTC